jgi:hypothetical protein
MHSKWYTQPETSPVSLYSNEKGSSIVCLYKDVEWNWNDKYQVTCVLLPRSALFRNQNTCKRTGRPIQNKTLVLSEKIEPPSEKLCSRVCVCAPIFGCLLCRGHRRRNAAQYFQSITFFSSCSRLPFSNKKKEIWSPPRIIIILFLSFSQSEKKESQCLKMTCLTW